ncbi:uncharacterized protein LOC130778286 isoform X2 [Actinidia eriantha]|uniref:uncharacterized protein LOC130778286 isoform X2 n=1 Tax=Actinidia eriantha TaxID=165200 RepID=UPI0025846147|nr:uncharacterized protein LOC130778286 isoform X2 [Actinidia eriantha]
MELIRRYWRNIERTLENLRFRFGDKASKDSLAAAVEEGESTILECYIYVFEALLLSDYIHEGAFILSHPLPPPHRELVAKGQTRSYACKNICNLLQGYFERIQGDETGQKHCMGQCFDYCSHINSRLAGL